MYMSSMVAHDTVWRFTVTRRHTSPAPAYTATGPLLCAGEVRARVHTRRSQPVSLHVHYNQVHVQVHADADQMHATQSAVDLHTGVCSISRR